MFQDWEFTATVVVPSIAIAMILVNSVDSKTWNAAYTQFLDRKKIELKNSGPIKALVRTQMLVASIEPTIFGCILACFQLSMKFGSHKEIVFLTILALMMIAYYYAKHIQFAGDWDDLDQKRLEPDIIESLILGQSTSYFTPRFVINCILVAAYLTVIMTTIAAWSATKV